MRSYSLIIFELLVSAGMSFGSIEYLEQRFYPEESFTRISEYFNGKEAPSNRTIIRSDALNRTGHYITFQLSSPYAVDHFKLEVYEFGARETTDYIFKPDTSVEVGKPIFLGLTGEKWEEQSKPPVAYRLSLIDKDGISLISATSFLWGDD